MIVYVVTAKSRDNGASKVSSISYEDIKDAVNFCKTRGDYLRSRSIFEHEGVYHEYIITETRCEEKKK